MAADNSLMLYVYYKLPVESNAACLIAVKQLHEAIKLHYPELTMQKQKRPQADANNFETWMEAYTGITEAKLEKFILELSALAKTYGLPSERKYEIFINL